MFSCITLMITLSLQCRCPSCAVRVSHRPPQRQWVGRYSGRNYGAGCALGTEGRGWAALSNPLASGGHYQVRITREILFFLWLAQIKKSLHLFCTVCHPPCRRLYALDKEVCSTRLPRVFHVLIAQLGAEQDSVRFGTGQVRDQIHQFRIRHLL
jgi:hypothetical protein